MSLTFHVAQGGWVDLSMHSWDLGLASYLELYPLSLMFFSGVGSGRALPVGGGGDS